MFSPNCFSKNTSVFSPNCFSKIRRCFHQTISVRRLVAFFTMLSVCGSVRIVLWNGSTPRWRVVGSDWLVPAPDDVWYQYIVTNTVPNFGGLRYAFLEMVPSLDGLWNVTYHWKDSSSWWRVLRNHFHGSTSRWQTVHGPWHGSNFRWRVAHGQWRSSSFEWGSCGTVIIGVVLWFSCHFPADCFEFLWHFESASVSRDTDFYLNLTRFIVPRKWKNIWNKNDC